MMVMGAGIALLAVVGECGAMGAGAVAGGDAIANFNFLPGNQNENNKTARKCGHKTNEGRRIMFGLDNAELHHNTRLTSLNLFGQTYLGGLLSPVKKAARDRPRRAAIGP